jgi:hypothetical protein
MGVSEPPAVNRLWFRLDEVLPLAAHAVACTEHHLTKAQVLAGAPTRPALIWHGTATADTLTSNGVPQWYTATGDRHAATSHTWFHQPSGRYGVAGSPGQQERHGYLPLTALPGERYHLIDWLEAESHVRYWMAINVTSTEPLITANQISLRRVRRNRYPADVQWTPATVACVPATGPNTYPALVARDYTSSAGGQLARFDRPTIDQMIGDLNARRALGDSMPGEHVLLRWHNNAVEVYEEVDDGDRSSYRRHDVVTADGDGRYALGGCTWPWLIVA